MPDNEDPDSFVNKNGKDYFIQFTKEKKISIHNFIFNHYKNETTSDPSSLAIFEKKIRTIAGTIKDDYIKKYVLEFFLEKISLLTPNTNQNKHKTYFKKAKSLKTTQVYFNETKDLSSIEIKEFSFLYFVINNLSLIKNNFNLIQDVKLFSTENKIIYESIFNKISTKQELSINDLSIDSQILNKISKFASIKHILNKLDNDEYRLI